MVDALVAHLPSPAAGAAAKVEQTYSGDLGEALVAGMLSCDAGAALMCNVTKMYHKPDCESFDAFGRVLSGTLRVGQEVRYSGSPPPNGGSPPPNSGSPPRSSSRRCRAAPRT